MVSDTTIWHCPAATEVTLKDALGPLPLPVNVTIPLHEVDPPDAAVNAPAYPFSVAANANVAPAAVNESVPGETDSAATAGVGDGVGVAAIGDGVGVATIGVAVENGTAVGAGVPLGGSGVAVGTVTPGGAGEVPPPPPQPPTSSTAAQSARVATTCGRGGVVATSPGACITYQLCGDAPIPLA